jgi:hypothetical protein
MQLVRGHRKIFRTRHDLEHTQGIQWRYSSGHLEKLATTELGMTFYSIWMPNSQRFAMYVMSPIQPTTCSAKTAWAAHRARTKRRRLSSPAIEQTDGHHF